MIRIGTAGWSIGRDYSDRFDVGDSHLSRYATRFTAVEINSSFHRPHRIATYARWRDSVPKDFRFSVKLPKTITHTKRLKAIAKDLDKFLAEATTLGNKLGPLLVQLPPNHTFERKTIGTFITRLRDRFDGAVAWEPRHASWFTGEADAFLAAHKISRVAADPAVVPAAAKPGGWHGLEYWRLHGSPRRYYSSYEPAFLKELAGQLPQRRNSWVIFDNTTLGFAVPNAFALQQILT